FEHALRGMRNPMNSWKKSDSKRHELTNEFVIGEGDLKLAKSLIQGGSEHRKFLRQIYVSVDITAPLYFWKEFDTYKIGTTANSTSTMHKLASTPITLDCFEIDDYTDLPAEWWEKSHDDFITSELIPYLEQLRKKFVETNNKKVWKELVRWLPESWLQKRTITMNYENLLNIYRQRKNHKLNEWSGIDDPTKESFIAWIETLPYARELIIPEVIE
ncbi:MAG: hypothetical protein NC452_20795, partial [Eubacterium sp.]|nr:hypothetical protein [Eubacterium sp.]